MPASEDSKDLWQDSPFPSERVVERDLPLERWNHEHGAHVERRKNRSQLFAKDLSATQGRAILYGGLEHWCT